jgi:CHAT domain-containing protein/tetratricopeptide (TPR) repeat protein
MLIRRFFLLLLILSLPGVFAQAQVTQEPLALVPGQPVEREIAAGESHTYHITLASRQFVRFRLEQRALDAILVLAAPDGKQLVEMNLTSAGYQEALSREAAADGTYRLTVRGVGAAALRGSYRLEAAVNATATAQDRQRLTAEALLIEANELEKQADKTAPQVIEKLRQALPVWHELGERTWVAWSLTRIGHAYYALRQFEKALENYEQALSVWRELKNRAAEGAALTRIGNAHYNLIRFDKALENYEQALPIWVEIKNRAAEGSALTNLGNANNNLGRFEKATGYLEQAVAIAREVKDRRAEASALHNLGNANISLGRYEQALENLGLALSIWREVKNRQHEAMVINTLGTVYTYLGRYERTIEYLEQALPIYLEVKDWRGQGMALYYLGGSYAALSRYERAIEYYEQAVTISRVAKNRRGEGLAIAGLADVHQRLEQYEKALEYFGQALPIAQEEKNRKYEGGVLIGLGRVYSKLSRFDKAIESYEPALTIYREVKDRQLEGLTLLGLGEAQQQFGQRDKAAESLTSAVALFREIKAEGSEASALAALAFAERERGNLAAARTLIEESLRIAESLRAGVISPESRASYLGSVQGAYQLYTDLLMRQHQAETTKGLDALALEVSERQRARSLLDLLAEAGADVSKGVDAALLERERSLARQLNDKAQRLVQGNKPDLASALKQEISQLETDYERAQAAIRSSSPRYAALVQPQPLKLKEIQQQLDADTLLLEYALGEERSYLWAITKDSLTSYELPKGEQIKQSALQVYELLTARSTNKRGESVLQRQQRIAHAEAALPAAAQGLSQTILAPVAAQLGNKRLVIVADGALQYIPFAMLPEPRSLDFGLRSLSNPLAQATTAKPKSQRPKTEDQPLIVNHEVVSLPSASALAIQRKELAGRQLAPKMLAVIADPVFDRSDSRFTTPATETTDKTQTIAGDDARSIEHLAANSSDKSGVTTLRLVIPRLPFTRREADQLLALTPKISSFRAIDFQASRTTALDPVLGQYRYLHFATHGYLDSERPGLSALVFSMVDAQGKPQNGFLRSNDIYNLKLPAELVVLSACQTGLGKDVKGEGLVGLTRGFMYAGAARVVVSLWNVNDKATADLMTRFYEKMLKQGERPSAALRAAQVEMWKQKQWQSPYYWAAFTMQGEWR